MADTIADHDADTVLKDGGADGIRQAINENTEAIERLSAAVRAQNELLMTVVNALRSRTGIW